jgi:hypothetical protein
MFSRFEVSDFSLGSTTAWRLGDIGLEMAYLEVLLLNHVGVIHHKLINELAAR